MSLNQFSKENSNRDSRMDIAEVFPPLMDLRQLDSTEKVFQMVSGLPTSTTESSLTQRVSTRDKLAPSISASRLSTRLLAGRTDM